MDRFPDGHFFPIATDDYWPRLAVLELANAKPDWEAKDIVAELARSERERGPLTVAEVQTILDERARA